MKYPTYNPVERSNDCILVGEQTRTCQYDGQWSGQEPVCELLQCKDLQDIRNGRVVLSGTTVGSTATYSCDKGYVLFGEQTRTCQYSGEWSGEEPYCELLQCQQLKGISYGSVVLTGTTVGSTATYSCFKGYILVGEQTRTCQYDGQWSGQEPLCKLVLCNRLYAIRNGKVVVSGSTVGSTATYICYKGFALVGQHVRTCQPDGRWTGLVPFCKSVIVDCGLTLTAPANGFAHVPCTRQDCTVTYWCRSGYALVGYSTRTCLASGYWSNDTPACQRDYY